MKKSRDNSSATKPKASAEITTQLGSNDPEMVNSDKQSNSDVPEERMETAEDINTIRPLAEGRPKLAEYLKSIGVKF